MKGMALAQKAQDAGLPYPDLRVSGSRKAGYTVRERGQVVAQGFRNSVEAQRVATQIRDERWTADLAAMGEV